MQPRGPFERCLQLGHRHPDGQCSVSRSNTLLERDGSGEVDHRPRQVGGRPAVDLDDLARRQGAAVPVHGGAATSPAGAGTRDVHPAQRIGPHGQRVQDARRAVAQRPARSELRHRRLDQQPVPLLVGEVPLVGPEVGAPPEPDQVAPRTTAGHLGVGHPSGHELSPEHHLLHAARPAPAAHAGQRLRALCGQRPVRTWLCGWASRGRHTQRTSAHPAGCAGRKRVCRDLSGVPT